LVSAGVSPNGKTPKVAQTNQPSGSAKDPVTDPVALIALSLVGIDPEAELYWLAAINDRLAAIPLSERASFHATLWRIVGGAATQK